MAKYMDNMDDLDIELEIPWGSDPEDDVFNEEDSGGETD